MVFVAFALGRFTPTTFESYFARVHGVVDDLLDELRSEMFVLRIDPWLLAIAMRIQPRGQRVHAFAFIDELIEYQSDNFRFILANFQMAFAFLILQEPVPEGILSAVPFTIVGLLLTSVHGLLKDILMFYLGERSHEGNHHLAHLGFAVDAIPHANEVRTVVLHELQRRQRIGRITFESA